MLLLICWLSNCWDMPVVEGTLEKLNLSHEQTVVQSTTNNNVSTKVMVAKLQDIPATAREQQIQSQTGLVHEKLNLPHDPATVQRTIDDDARIKAMVAKLQDIPATDKQQQIELQAGLAYLSLFSASTSFVSEAKRLVELTNEIDIEQLNPQVQAILHLANNAGVEGSDAIKIPRESQNVVDGLCARDSNLGLGRVTHDLQKLSKNFYQWKMTLACYELIRDKSPPDIARHLAVVPVVADSNQPCLFVKKSGVVVLVASWFTCALQQKGIDMNSLLESIQRKHHRIYEEALLEAGMPFRYPNELLTMRP